MKLLHAADLHIDSPMRGLSRYEDAPVHALRSSTRRAVENLVAAALKGDVDAVLLAGDIYDGDWPDINTGLFFRKQMLRLADEGIEVFLVSGNHDAASQISRELTLPEHRGIHMLDDKEPQTVIHGKLPLAVHGQGYRTRDVTSNLAVGFPPSALDAFNVGLLHTALDGRPPHAPYAPCSVAELMSLGYDYWALGHVHTREVVAEEPYIVFPGNLQGRSVREVGARGATLVTVDESGKVTIDELCLDVVRWAHLNIDATRARDLEDVLASTADALSEAASNADGRLLATRVSITGDSEAHFELWRERERLTAEVRALAGETDEVWVEKVLTATRPADSRAAADNRMDLLEAVNDLRATARELRADGDALRQLIADAPLMQKLPNDARGADRIDAANTEWVGRLFDDAVELLTAVVEEAGR